MRALSYRDAPSRTRVQSEPLYFWSTALYEKFAIYVYGGNFQSARLNIFGGGFIQRPPPL